MKSPIELLSSLLQGCKRLEPCVKGIDRDIITVKHRFEHEGYGFLTITLPSLCDAFDKGLSTGKFACPTGLKKVRGGAIPRLFSGMLCEVFDLFTGTILSQPNLGIIKLMREICRCFKKLALNSDQVERLDLEAKSKFFSVEETCKDGVQLDPRQLNVLKAVRSCVLTKLDIFLPSELLPKHGPGAVVESVTTNQKWSVVLDSLNRVSEYGFDRLAACLKRLGMPDRHRPTSNSAKLVTVPKDSTSRRTITVEPCVNQFLQQGLNTYLRDHIKKDPVLRRCLALTDQTKNQILALEGSRTDRWATIDLSSASDLLTSSLVRLVFEEQSSFLELLFDARSPEVLDNGVAKELEKFAGMGNATTFPVQSVVFAVVAISAILDCRHEWPTSRSVARIARRIRVYGDDIIVPTEYAQAVVGWLSASGLKVNMKKSFLQGYFKESCGVDAYSGVDVTPLYVRHLPSDLSKRTPEIIKHYVDLSNHAWMRGLYEFSDLLRQYAEDALGKPLPHVHSQSGAFGLHTRREWVSVQRWSKTLHRFELRTHVLQSVYRKDQIDGYEALTKFFVSSESTEDREPRWYDVLFPKEQDPQHLVRSPVRFKSKISQRWVPA